MQPGRLRVEGRFLRTPSGETVQLRGLNVCSLEFDPLGKNWELSDGRSQLVETLADPAGWNANVVRVPLNQQWFLEDDAYVARVEAVLDTAAAHGLYAILDAHWEVGRHLEPYHANILKTPTFGPGNTTEAFWRKVVGRWSQRTHLLYDLINEPHGLSVKKAIAALQALADCIVAQQPDAMLVVGGPNWAHSVDVFRDHPLRAPNVIYSAHQYLPHDPPSRFEANFGRLARSAPVLIGELAAEAPAPGSGSVPYARQLVDYAEAHELAGWLVWAVGCGFSAHEREDREPLRFLSRTMREQNRSPRQRN